MAKEIRLRQDIGGICKLDAIRRIIDRLVGVERHMLPGVDIGLEAQLLQKTQIAPDPECGDPIVRGHPKPTCERKCKPLIRWQAMVANRNPLDSNILF